MTGDSFEDTVGEERTYCADCGRIMPPDCASLICLECADWYEDA